MLFVSLSSYLQVCRSLESLAAQTADMAAVLAVSLLAVASQSVGILAHLVTVVTLVTVIRLSLGVLSTFVAVVRNLAQTQDTDYFLHPIVHDSNLVFKIVY